MSNFNGYGIVTSSEIIICRNLDNELFPHRISRERAREICSRISDFFLENKEMKFKKVNLWEEFKERLSLFLEEGIISRKLYENKKIATFLINNEKTITIMINAENHITIRVKGDGLCLKEIYSISEDLLEQLELNFDFAFDEEFGYLTSSLSNIGTGFNVSSVLHLPILSLTKDIDLLINELNGLGIILEELYLDETQAIGDLYKLTNKVTIGVSEEEIVSDIEAVTYKIIMKEKNKRAIFLESDKEELEDMVFRAKGILSNARKLDLTESLSLLSMLRLGIEIGIVDDIFIKDINRLTTLIQYNNIKKDPNEKITENEETIIRANIIREALRGSKV